MSVKERIRVLARDLTSLEINTIRRGSITGESMPDPRHALYDVASEYNSELNRLLKGDRRLAEGTEASLQCTFGRPTYDPGESGVVHVIVRDPAGTPMAGGRVEACVCLAPVFMATAQRGGARVARFSGPTRAPVEIRCDAEGHAAVPFTLDAADQPGVAIRLTCMDATTQMQVPFRKVRGSLHAFHYLNSRANDARDTAQPWLVRRIELNSIRLATLLETLAPPPDSHGCDQNDYTRRHLNGSAEKDGDQVREKPPEMALSTTDRVTLRKVWELGCEEILMQTLVQLDGDVVTRLTDGGAREEASVMHRLHSEGVRVATQSWRHLVDSLGSFARSLF